jgi:hypothetical protein
LVTTLASKGTRSRSRQQRHLLVAGVTSRTGEEPVGLLPGLQGHQVQEQTAETSIGSRAN